MSKYSRSGGKFTGNHTTLIPIACILADAASSCPNVTRITPGFIKAGLSALRGQRRAKMTGKNGYILLAVRDNTTQQEVHIYTKDLEVTKGSIEKEALRLRLRVSLK